MRFALCLIGSLSLITTSNAQEKSATGYALNWTGSVQVAPDTITNGTHKLPAFALPIHEADPGKALDLWKTQCAMKGGKVSGSDPYRSTPILVDGLGAAPVVVMATTAKDKQLGGTRMLVTYALNDSVPAPDAASAQQAAHDLALALNRAVVMEQIADQQKLVDKLNGKLESAQADQAKAEKKAGDANKDLEKVKQQQSKLSGKQAQLQSDELHAQQRYDRTKNPKDLEKLSKIKAKLVKVQQDLAKQMEKEASAQKKVNSRQGDIPDANKEEQEKQAAKEKANTDLEALKRKLEAVR